jgi:hypothetical protein
VVAVTGAFSASVVLLAAEASFVVLAAEFAWVAAAESLGELAVGLFSEAMGAFVVGAAGALAWVAAGALSVDFSAAFV